MHLHPSDVMNLSTRGAISAFARALKGLSLHHQSCNVSSRASALRVGHQRALHALQQQVWNAPTACVARLYVAPSYGKSQIVSMGLLKLQLSPHPHVPGCVRGVSSPRQLVSMLPGQCRGAALEVDNVADEYDRSSGAEQGATAVILLVS